MTLQNFDPDLTSRQQVRTTPPPRRTVVTESVAVIPLPSESRTHLTKSEGDWGWAELRDYVVASIEERFGAFPRDARKEFGIFSRFAGTYGAQSAEIARYAFEVCNGWWANAPISVNRFCKGSDTYFADPILKRLADLS